MTEVVITLKKMYKTLWFIILEHAQFRPSLETQVIHFVAILTYVIPSGVLQLHTSVKIELGKIIDLKLFQLKSIISIIIMLIHVWH